MNRYTYLRAGFIGAALATLFWGIWSLFFPVPYYGIDPESTSGLSRWWDVPFSCVVGIVVVYLVNLFNKVIASPKGIILPVSGSIGLCMGILIGLAAGIGIGLIVGFIISLGIWSMFKFVMFVGE